MKEKIVVAAAVLLSCQNSQQGEKNHVDSLLSSADSAMHVYQTSKMADSFVKQAKENAQEESMKTSWTYDTRVDKMTSKSTYAASVDANELLQMDFPYNGGVVASLYLQNRRGTNSVLLQVSKGQIMEHGVKIRFDSGKVMSFEGFTPSDGDSKFLFIEPAGRMISNLKKAKRVVIEAEFFDNGIRQMEFDVGGLNWAH